MANHPSALKRIRQTEKRRLRNMSFRSKVKTAVKKYLLAVASKDQGAQQLLREASSLLQKGVTKGIYHRNAAARTISRLALKTPAA